MDFVFPLPPVTIKTVRVSGFIDRVCLTKKGLSLYEAWHSFQFFSWSSYEESFSTR